MDPSDPANNGFINQDFLVWMRRAALPDFRKLYRRITEGDYASGLPAGNYSLEIAYSILIHITDSEMMLGGMGTYVSLALILCLNMTHSLEPYLIFFNITNYYWIVIYFWPAVNQA